LDSVRSERTDATQIGFMTAEQVAATMDALLATQNKKNNLQWWSHRATFLQPNQNPGTFIFYDTGNSKIDKGKSNAFLQGLADGQSSNLPLDSTARSQDFSYTEPWLNGNTLEVPTNFKTIQDAINAAQPGDTVFVKKGRYNEFVKFKSGIELKGEDRDTTIVSVRAKPTATTGQDAYDSPLEARNCNRGSISQITFLQNEQDDRPWIKHVWKTDAIYIDNSSIKIENCRAWSKAGAGILVSGRDSNPELVNNSVSDCAGGGIRFRDGAHGLIIRNVVSENYGFGINALDATPQIVENVCDFSRRRPDRKDSISVRNPCANKRIDPHQRKYLPSKWGRWDKS
jgi:hypothetical protein